MIVTMMSFDVEGVNDDGCMDDEDGERLDDEVMIFYVGMKTKLLWRGRVSFCRFGACDHLDTSFFDITPLKFWGFMST